MSRTIEYQSKADPTGDVTQLSKDFVSSWQQPPPDPVVARPSRAHLTGDHEQAMTWLGTKYAGFIPFSEQPRFADMHWRPQAAREGCLGYVINPIDFPGDPKINIASLGTQAILPVWNRPRACDFPTADATNFMLTEVVTVDKYFIRPPDPPALLVRPLPVGGHQHIAFVPPSITVILAFPLTGYYYSWFEVTFVTGWQIQPPDPVRPKANVPEGLSVGPLSPNVVAPTIPPVSCWMPEAAERPVYRTPLRLYEGTPGRTPFVPPPETILVSKWWQPASEPVRGKPSTPAATPGLFAFVPDQTTFQPVPVGSWFTQASEPVKARPATQHGYYVLMLDPVRDLQIGMLSQWFTGASEPVRGKPRIPAAEPGLSVYTVDPTQTQQPLLASWYVEWTEPVRSRLAANLGPAFAAVIDPTVIQRGQLDQWFQPASEPVKNRAPVQYGAVSMVIDPTTIKSGQLDQWYKQAAEPVWKRPAPNVGPDLCIGLDPTQIKVGQVDQWFVPASEPVRSRPAALPIGHFAAHLAPMLEPAAILATWWQPASEPVRIRPAATPASIVLAAEPTILHAGQLDQWFVQPSEPVRTRPRPNDGPALALTLDPTQINAPGLASWWQPTQQPVLRRPVPVYQAGYAGPVDVIIIAPPASVLRSVVVRWSYAPAVVFRWSVAAPVFRWSSTMAVSGIDLTMTRGEDLSFTAVPETIPAGGIGGWTIRWQLRVTDGGTIAVTKDTLAIGGVSIVNPTSGIIGISLTRADTSSLAIQTTPWYWELRRVDSGASTVLSKGTLVIEAENAAP